jgi:hypothetical protein
MLYVLGIHHCILHLSGPASFGKINDDERVESLKNGICNTELNNNREKNQNLALVCQSMQARKSTLTKGGRIMRKHPTKPKLFSVTQSMIVFCLGALFFLLVQLTLFQSPPALTDPYFDHPPDDEALLVKEKFTSNVGNPSSNDAIHANESDKSSANAKMMLQTSTTHEVEQSSFNMSSQSQNIEAFEAPADNHKTKSLGTSSSLNHENQALFTPELVKQGRLRDYLKHARS